MFGEFCQYSTGAKQLIGLVVVLIVCRGGKGVAGAVRPCSDEKKIARRWAARGGACCSCRQTCGPFRMHISNKHGDKIQQQASTRYELMIDTLAIDFRAARQICCRRHL